MEAVRWECGPGRGELPSGLSIQGDSVHQSKLLFAAVAAVAVAGLASTADATTTFDTSLPNPPGVFFGSGNFNDGYAVTTGGGLTIGLKSKIHGDATDSITPVGDVYTIGLGNKINFDYAILGGSTANEASITILNERTGQTASFNPMLTAINDGSFSGNNWEDSEQLAFYPAAGFDMNQNNTFDVTMTVDSGWSGPQTVENIIHVGSGQIPEPATWAMMVLGLGGVGAVLRRNRRSIAPAIA